VLGEQTSYTYQLAHLADALQRGQPFPGGIDGSVANAELIDECYRRAVWPTGQRPLVREVRPRRCRDGRAGSDHPLTAPDGGAEPTEEAR